MTRHENIGGNVRDLGLGSVVPHRNLERKVERPAISTDYEGTSTRAAVDLNDNLLAGIGRLM
jgi:hypothetical protein